MALGSMSAGLLADGLVRRGMSVTNVRKALQTVAFVIPAAALVVLANPGISTTTAVACLTIALGTTSLGNLQESPKPQQFTFKFEEEKCTQERASINDERKRCLTREHRAIKVQ